MSEETQIETKEYSATATYCPEDNKLRLYCGRVPREEYLRLRNEGWRALHKQREAGGGDFVTTWTPERRDTCLRYAGIIEDEDMGPAERAADRAERFSGYRDKRTSEATVRADDYDSQPLAHGFQSEKKAERAAERHDRIADRACDAWSKAEYWQRRTAGVIAHALYKSEPGVRMGRIKELEKLLRAHEANLEKYRKNRANWIKIAAIADQEEQTKAAKTFAGWHDRSHATYKHPHPELVTGYCKDNEVSLYSLLTNPEAPITGAEACALYFSDHHEAADDSDWSLHYKLRLAYEQQMLEAQGGMLEQKDVEVGGKLGGKLIIKVNKSPATGRCTSVSILGPRVSGYTYRAGNIPGTEWAEHQFDLERMKPGAYTPPTPESLKELEEAKAKIKAGKPVVDCPLINPNEGDAIKLQEIWNRSNSRREPGCVVKMTQAQYSARSKGGYGPCETVIVSEFGVEKRDHYMGVGSRCSLFKVRKMGGGCNNVDHVVIIADKPQKPLPWKKLEDARASQPSVESLLPRLDEIVRGVMENWPNIEPGSLLRDAEYAGLVSIMSCTQVSLTAQGQALAREHGCYTRKLNTEEVAA